ncbi:MAG: hypothetical protein K940chlam3_01118, partial [Chlamydiae bacterium]|nr:hypothetical protein [Chlamydiota bacterium]
MHFKNNFIYRVAFVALLIVMGITGACGALPMNPMGYEDIVTMAKPQSAIMSPQGNKTAYTVRRSHVEKNQNRDEFYIWNAQDKTSKKVFEADKILQVEWTEDEKTVYLLTQDKGQFHIVGGGAEGFAPLASFDERVSVMALSSDSQHLYYAIAQTTSDDVIKQKKELGYVYKWGEDNCFTLDGKHFKQVEFEEIWCLNVPSKKSYFLTRISCDGIYKNLDYYSRVVSIHPSEDERLLAFSLSKVGRSDKGEIPVSNEIVIWDTHQQQWKSLSVGLYKRINQPCWLSNTQLAFVESSIVNGVSAQS